MVAIARLELAHPKATDFDIFTDYIIILINKELDAVSLEALPSS